MKTQFYCKKCLMSMYNMDEEKNGIPKLKDLNNQDVICSKENVNKMR